MNLEITGGEALDRIKDLLPEFEGMEAAGVATVASLDGAREELASAWSRLEEAAAHLREGVTARRGEREAHLEDARQALADLSAATEACQEETAAAREVMAGIYANAARDGIVTLRERRRVAQGERATKLEECLRRADEVRQRFGPLKDRAAHLVQVEAPARVRAWREETAARAEALRAHMLEECLPRLEEKAGALADRLTALGDHMAPVLDTIGNAVGGSGFSALIQASLEAFQRMSEIMAATTTMSQTALGQLSMASASSGEAAGERQVETDERNASLVELMQAAQQGLGEVMGGLASMSFTDFTVAPSGFGPIPIPFPNFGR